MRATGSLAGCSEGGEEGEAETASGSTEAGVEKTTLTNTTQAVTRHSKAPPSAGEEYAL